MKTHELIQGSPEWLAHRATHFNASDAPAMMGCSPYKTRAALLREMHTGIAADVDIATQKRFDNGHRAEALARPLAEKIIGEDLYPITGTEGRYSASFDGLTLDDRQGFEHKALNAELRAAFAAIDGLGPCDDEAAPGRLLPVHHRIQMEQQLLVSGAERILFMASEWTAAGDLVEERHCWYYPDDELRGSILAGWGQFERDLAVYVVAPAEAPKPVGATPETLPALRIEVTGAVTASNLDAFKTHAIAVIKGINRELTTDQHFADAEATVKWCASVEERLAAAKQHALSQTESIDALFRAIDDVSAEARRVRLDLDRLVKSRKDAIRTEIAEAAHQRYVQRVRDLSTDLQGIVTLGIPAALRSDIGEAMKGKRTVDTLRDAADTLVARELAQLESLAARYRANWASLGTRAHLVPDFKAVGAKEAEDFAALLALREHQHAEAARLQAEREAAARAEAERIAAERQAAEAARIAAAQASRITQGQHPQQVLKAEPATADATDRGTAADASPRGGAMGAGQAAAAAPVRDEPATLKLGTVCERLGFTMTAAFVSESLRIAPANTEGRAVLYRESQFASICDALIAHVAQQRQAFARQAVVATA